jgi:hypothetical protein
LLGSGLLSAAIPSRQDNITRNHMARKKINTVSRRFLAR